MSSDERRLLLLDRDGTLLSWQPSGYVLTWEDVVLAAGAAEAVAVASQHGFVPVLVTNQSCIGQGLTTQAWVDDVNAWLADKVSAAGGGPLLALSCPHVDADGCDCRKPKAGLLRAAARLTDLPLASAWMVGDSRVDFEAARAGGVARYFHVCNEDAPDICAAPGVQGLATIADLPRYVRAS